MRTSHAVTALAAFTAGLTAAATLRRRAGTRPPVASTATTPADPADALIPNQDAVVLPFARPVLTGPAPKQLASASRCGENGGRTKAGAPCAARATTGGRCHHHPMAA
jgi:hypothetical protein